MHSTIDIGHKSISLGAPSRRLLGIAGIAGAALTWCFSANVVWAQAPSVIEVRAGDTFSGIAGQFTGGMAGWRKMYRADLSGLPNPNLIQPGMRFEVATDSSGAKYLRLLPGGAQAPPVAAPVATPVAPPVLAKPAAAPAAVDRADGTLVIGVLPYVSATILVQQYDFLKRYLERVSGEKVSIVVPANFKAFSTTR